MDQEDKQEQGSREVQPRQNQGYTDVLGEESKPLSQMLAELRSQFGSDFDENDALFILRLEQALSRHKGLAESLRGKKADEAIQTFGQALPEIMQATVEAPYKLYKNMQDDKEFDEHLTGKLFKRFERRVKEEDGK